MIRVTTEDRKHASLAWVTIKRQAYGGNMQTAEVALARIIAEERERCAAKLDAIAANWPTITNMTPGFLIARDAFVHAARVLRGESLDTGAKVAENPPADDHVDSESGTCVS